MASRLAAIGAYRRLLRASRELFKGDTVALRSGREELRSHFLAHRDETDPAKLKDLFKDAKEVEEMMRVNLVQGKLNERGNYEVALKPIPNDNPDSSCPPKFEPTPVDLAEVERAEREYNSSKEKQH